MPDTRVSEYKRMDKLVKGVTLWTRRDRMDNSGPSQGHISTVKCVMTFACPPEGQVLVEVEGNFLTPDHYVARGNGTWTTAGELTPPGCKSSTHSALLVYNIRLQEGEHIEKGKRILGATLGARFDTTSSQKEPTYSEKDARHLPDLPGYSSGHIHWALGTALVDCHGIPTSSQRNDPPSKVGTSTLLDKDVFEISFCTQRAEQKWIDTLSMLRRVHSIWNHVARAIYPEFTKDFPGTQTSEDENSWRFAFHRERLKAGDRISRLRAPTEPSTTLSMSNILDELRTYPATLNTQIEAIKTLQWWISQIKQENYESEHFASRSHVITLYAALSRHIIRPNPYAAQDLNSQIQEHIAVTLRAIRTLCLGTLVLERLGKLHHNYHTAIRILLNSLRVLTAGRTPREKVGQDWKLTKQAAFILLINLKGMYREDLVRLGANTLETLKAFVQSHLISHESRWMKRKAYVAWSGVQESLTMNLYDMIKELLRIQSRQDTLHQTEMLQTIADSIGDTTQTEDVTIHGFSILSKLNVGSNSSPLDGATLKALRARWDLNSLSPKV